VEVLEGLDVTRVHEPLAVGPRLLYANLMYGGVEWPGARQRVKVEIWMTGFETASPVQWWGRDHEGDYDAVGFWDAPAGGRLVLSAAFGAPAYLGPGDGVMIAAGRLG
jgi:hypothetical protein